MKYNVMDFGMKPGTRCTVKKIDFLDENNKKKVVNCYFTSGPDKDMSRELLNIALDLGCKVPAGCKLAELQEIVKQHQAFKQITKLEKLGIKYGVKIIFGPKYHCELNAIEGMWCYMTGYTRKNSDQTFNRMLLLIQGGKINFDQKQ
ncbi:unnamed protein product, partial [Didymodactylos carnosus]